MNIRWSIILLILCSFFSSKVMGSHIVGGEVTYRYLGDSSGFQKYEISLSIYEDCQNGLPQAIAGDDTAILAVYVNDGRPQTPPYTGYDIDPNVYFKSKVTVPPNFSNACVSNIPATCLIRKTFTKVFALEPNPYGYVVAYQNCCRNSAIINIIDPGNNGSTYFCVIPPLITNHSAVFKNYPPQIICLNNPMYYDHSATDEDGDSLTYEFCPALGFRDPNPGFKTPPAPPPYDTVFYSGTFSYRNPMFGYPPISVDPHTGIITGTPNRIGRYLVTICCHEWRAGELINTIKREFQFVVTDCSKLVVADMPQYSTDANTYIVNCADNTVHFVNTSKGGFAYKWDFGVPHVGGDTSSQENPTFTYPDTGTFAVKLVANPGTTCPDSITRLVKVYPKFHASFTNTGSQCPGSAIQFLDLSSATIKPISLWKWNFGDGDSSLLQNPMHAYKYGGTYNVVLVSRSVKNCIDTALSQVLVETFKPFAGSDTTIVKGESILFNAVGGLKYTWSPETNLSDTAIFGPRGYYADTGTFTYTVRVESAFGCIGEDTIHVTVVNQASFFVPTGFSPNGDGRNDIFRPISVGYSSLDYLRVFNRFGEQVYYGNTLETGWDGTFKGQPAEMGVYFWEISFKDRFGKPGFLKGDVTLIR